MYKRSAIADHWEVGDKAMLTDGEMLELVEIHISDWGNSLILESCDGDRVYQFTQDKNLTKLEAKQQRLY